MTVFFRADASTTIGYGHISRCLTLAQILKPQNRIVFLCQETNGNAAETIYNAGYDLYLLPETSNQQADAAAVGTILNLEPDPKNNILIVDHYLLDATWEKVQMPYIHTLVVLDDLANREHFCHVLIDQSMVHTSADYQSLLPSNCRFIGGSNLIIRPEFTSASYCLEQSTIPNSAMLCMGGGDADNITLHILQTLESNPVSDLNLTVVTGPAYPHLKNLALWLKSSRLNICHRHNINNMANMLRQHTAAIVSSGNLALECCALGIPTITLAIADNQKQTADFLAKQQAVILLDHMLSDFPAQLNQALTQLLTNSAIRSTLQTGSRLAIHPHALTEIANLIYAIHQSH